MVLHTGLDSFTASEVMEVVKSLVTSGITIAATIHSPTPRTFQLFDRVLILQRGRIVFFGDNGESAKQYFAASPYFEVCIVHGNRIMCDGKRMCNINDSRMNAAAQVTRLCVNQCHLVACMSKGFPGRLVSFSSV